MLSSSATWTLLILWSIAGIIALVLLVGIGWKTVQPYFVGTTFPTHCTELAPMIIESSQEDEYPVLKIYHPLPSASSDYDLYCEGRAVTATSKFNYVEFRGRTDEEGDYIYGYRLSNR